VLRTLFGYTEIGKKRYYTFMASPKLPWDTLWPRLWKMIPDPETGGRLIVALDDYINIFLHLRDCDILKNTIF
jgi:hypothetical protein